MARQDMDIKADIIAELEDVRAPHSDKNILDALMVEAISVKKGRAELTLVFPDARLEQDRGPLNAALEDRLAEIEGVQAITFVNLSREQLRRQDPLAWFGEAGDVQIATSSSAAPAPSAAPPAGGLLTLDALLSAVPEEPEPQPSGSGATLELYNGGGCSIGTSEASLSSPAPQAAPAPTPAPAPAPAPKPQAAPAPAPKIQGHQVTLDLDTYQRLLLAERELALRPSMETYQDLLVRHQLLVAKVQTLQEAMQVLFSGT